MLAIVIPVKRFKNAKLRLSGILDADHRRRLGLAMLEDVLEATRAWPSRFIVTGEESVRPLVQAAGCVLINDDGTGLNHCVEAGTMAAIKAGAVEVVVLPCDVPLVTEKDVAALFSSRAEVALTPSPDGGTNALMRRPPSIIRSAFGPGSAQAHLRAAELAEVRTEILKLDSLTLDVDSYQDLIALAQTDLPLRSVDAARALVSIGIAADFTTSVK